MVFVQKFCATSGRPCCVLVLLYPCSHISISGRQTHKQVCLHIIHIINIWTLDTYLFSNTFHFYNILLLYKTQCNRTIHKPSLSLRHMKMSLNECIERKSWHCRWIPGSKMHDEVGDSLLGDSGSHMSQMAFFCGSHPDCNILNGEKLFRIATQVSFS